MWVEMKKHEKIIQKVIDEKIMKPQLLYKDNVGNTLWIKYIKTRGRTQFFDELPHPCGWGFLRVYWNDIQTCFSQIAKN